MEKEESMVDKIKDKVGEVVENFTEDESEEKHNENSKDDSNEIGNQEDNNFKEREDIKDELRFDGEGGELNQERVAIIEQEEREQEDLVEDLDKHNTHEIGREDLEEDLDNKRI